MGQKPHIQGAAGSVLFYGHKKAPFHSIFLIIARKWAVVDRFSEFPLPADVVSSGTGGIDMDRPFIRLRYAEEAEERSRVLR